MESMNKIFMQLREADKYARAKNPHLRRFAVMLLDNVIELQLRRKAQWESARDRTTWYDGVRRHGHKVRKQVLRNNAELYEFARQIDWISEDGYRILTYAHEVRNECYHEGRYERIDVELAIRLLYKFIREYFPTWRTCLPMISISPYDAIPIEEAAEDGGFSPLIVIPGEFWRDELKQSDVVQDPKYWEGALDRLLRYTPADDLRMLIFKKLTELLDSTETYLDSITENPMDYNWVLSNRFCVCTPAFIEWIKEGQQIRNPLAL